MAEFQKLDEAAFKEATARNNRPALPRALSARFDPRSHRVIVSLDTGLIFSFDPRKATGLADAAVADFKGVRLEGTGSTLRFPKLDADFTVSRLLERFVGPLDWTRAEARAMASRENGKRGGRPKRQPAATAQTR